MAVAENQSRTGTYSPTTFIFDVAELQQTDVTSPHFKELLIRLYQNVGLMSNIINLKDTGYYLQQEVNNSQSWYPNATLTQATPQKPDFRRGYTTVVPFPVLPNANTVSQPHGIAMGPQFFLTFFQGAATNPAAITVPMDVVGIPLPYSSSTTIVDNIEMWLDNTNVYLASQADYSAFNGVVTIKYLKQ
jgi:hypothetical protein